jgi:type I restriction enzyme, R subunit
MRNEPHPLALAIRGEMAFFQAVKAALAKTTGTGDTPDHDEQVEHAIRQIVSRAVASDKVVDIFSAAGLKKPDISILSDEFLAEVKDLPQRNLAVELLRRLMSDKVRASRRKNVVQSRSFAEMLEKTIRAYQNRTIETTAVIQELIELAKHMREAHQRGGRNPWTYRRARHSLQALSRTRKEDRGRKVLEDQTGTSVLFTK